MDSQLYWSPREQTAIQVAKTIANTAVKTVVRHCHGSHGQHVHAPFAWFIGSSSAPITHPFRRSRACQSLPLAALPIEASFTLLFLSFYRINICMKGCMNADMSYKYVRVLICDIHSRCVWHPSTPLPSPPTSQNRDVHRRGWGWCGSYITLSVTGPDEGLPVPTSAGHTHPLCVCVRARGVCVSTA